MKFYLSSNSGTELVRNFFSDENFTVRYLNISQSGALRRNHLKSGNTKNLPVFCSLAPYRRLSAQLNYGSYAQFDFKSVPAQYKISPEEKFLRKFHRPVPLYKLYALQAPRGNLL